MEQPTKKSRQDLVGKGFSALVAQTKFADRYHSLCKKYPFWLPRAPSCSKTELFRLLSEIGKTPRWDARDKSCSFDFAVGEWSAGNTFVLQRATVEFMFSASRENERVGSNYAVIAYAATELIDPAKALRSRFPRPHVSSLSDLRDVLLECFQLSDLLISALSKMPAPQPNEL